MVIVPKPGGDSLLCPNLNGEYWPPIREVPRKQLTPVEIGALNASARRERICVRGLRAHVMAVGIQA
jgi:hypothetical protein